MEAGVTIDKKSPSTSSFALSDPAIRIAPSLLSADFSQLAESVNLIERAGAPIIHLDVMDGHFVPNISFGPGVIKSIRKHSKMFFDAHLMIMEPHRYAESFVEAGCDHITFHIEVTKEPKEVIKIIRDLGVSVGVSLNPTTEISQIESILDQVDMVLVMSVWPGFGGQAFLSEVLPKVAELRKHLGSHQRLEIDGGIDLQTIGAASAAGADTFVAGTAVYKADDPPAAMKKLYQLALESSVIQSS